jgi:hypothetical protein
VRLLGTEVVEGGRGENHMTEIYVYQQYLTFVGDCVCYSKGQDQGDE